jgi:hypothetical protein
MNIKIVYFTYLVPEKWESIVNEQLTQLKNLTFLYNMSTIFMSVTDDTPEKRELKKLQILLSKEYNKIQLINTFSENVYEYPGIKTVYEVSTNNEHEYILYFHSKGITHSICTQGQVMFDYTIKPYEAILNEMEKNLEIDISTAIPCINGFGYYNFWWARSSYINKYCSKPEITETYLKHNRFTWEMWLGNHYSKKHVVKTYSHILKYNNVYEECGASFIMNLLDDKIKITNNLGNPILLPEIIKNLGEPAFFNNIINPTIKPMSVFIDNNLTDKNTAHSYLDTYEKLFFPIRKTASNILEVGIYWGGSIQLWRDYFPYAQIYAVDICSLDFIRKPSILNDHNITLFTNTNGYDDTFIQSEFINKNIKFDMILDDGPHTIEGMINFIVKYLPLLSENGIMIIEDVQDFNWIEIFKQIVPNEYKKYIQVYDLRHIKNRYDDVLFVINKTISI